MRAWAPLPPVTLTDQVSAINLSSLAHSVFTTTFQNSDKIQLWEVSPSWSPVTSDLIIIRILASDWSQPSHSELWLAEISRTSDHLLEPFSGWKSLASNKHYILPPKPRFLPTPTPLAWEQEKKFNLNWNVSQIVIGKNRAKNLDTMKQLVVSETSKNPSAF